MGEYFRGWKRKLACITLVMAVMMSLEWARSFIRRDQVWIRLQNGDLIFTTQLGVIKYDWTPQPAFQSKVGWRQLNAYPPRQIQSIWHVGYREIPLLWGIIPLTLVSAYLLISTARKASQPAKQSSGQNSSNGQRTSNSLSDSNSLSNRDF